MAHNFVLERSPTRASDPYQDGVAFAGDADVTLDQPSRAIVAAADGTVTVDMLGYNGVAGATGLAIPVKAGMEFRVAITKIYNAGTDVAGIVLF